MDCAVPKPGAFSFSYSYKMKQDVPIQEGNSLRFDNHNSNNDNIIQFVHI